MIRAGYARNFLLPRKIALPITQANKKQMDALLARDAREARNSRPPRSLPSVLPRPVLRWGQAGGGKMFGAVTANDLITRLAEEGIELAKKQLALPAPIKEPGSHTAQSCCTRR